MLDGSGFVRRSEVFAGRVDEDKTLEPMLKALHAPADALVVMDAGIATEDNVAWLRDNGYRYLVVSRQRTRRFDPERSTAIETRSHHKVHLHKVVDEDRGEVRLYCYSEERAKKEEGIARRFAERFESELRKLHEGLSQPRTRKGLDSVWQRIGRIRERCRGAGQHYTVDVVADPHSAKAVAVTWKHKPLAGTMLTHPGVYCLRTNVHDWDPQTLWRTYTTLTDLEAVFRSLKSELGLRPIFHKTQNRSDGPDSGRRRTSGRRVLIRPVATNLGRVSSDHRRLGLLGGASDSLRPARDRPGRRGRYRAPPPADPSVRD